MIKLKNSLQIKKFLRIALIAIIVIQLILVTIQLYEYFHKLVLIGASTTTAASEGNYVIRFLNFFEIGVGSLIKENVVNICLPLLVYVLLRDRDREILYGDEQLEEITEAVKEGVIEGVDEVTSETHVKNTTKQNTEDKVQVAINQEIEKQPETNEQDNKINKEEIKDLNNNLDDFFAKLK